MTLFLHGSLSCTCDMNDSSNLLNHGGGGGGCCGGHEPRVSSSSASELYGTCDSHPEHMHAIQSPPPNPCHPTLPANAQYFQRISSINLLLAMLCVLVIGCNGIAIALNALNKDGSSCGMPDDSSLAQCGSPTSDLTFHLLEFWATFGFAITQSLSVSYSVLPTALCRRPILLKLFILLNVGCTFISAMLVTLDLDKFETVSHEIEYTNELFTAMMDLVMLAPLAQSWVPGGVSTSVMNIAIGAIAVAISIVQLVIYNGMGKDADGGMRGEKDAHFFEFTFTILSAIVSYWFCMDNKQFCDKQFETLMYGSIELNAPKEREQPTELDALKSSDDITKKEVPVTADTDKCACCPQHPV